MFLNEGVKNFTSQGLPGSVWRHFLLVVAGDGTDIQQVEVRMPASKQCARQLPTTKNSLVQHVSNAAIA